LSDNVGWPEHQMMSPPQLPEMNDVLRLARDSTTPADLSECHGVASGLICRLTEPHQAEFVETMRALQIWDDSRAEFGRALIAMFDSAAAQLADPGFAFQPWLPDDGRSLTERTEALGQWCTGFLAAMGAGGELGTLSDEAAEALEDLRQIAQAGMSPDTDSEEEEAAYVEIVEYVRVVAMMLREDFRGPRDGDSLH
jgi:uncharacterized protein YgfB (UPF0149 family)